MRIVAIAAVADNGVIGSGEDMLWHIPADFRRFKAVTTGNTIVFGRRTHEQVGLLPDRRTIVVTLLHRWGWGDLRGGVALPDGTGHHSRPSGAGRAHHFSHHCFPRMDRDQPRDPRRL